jgi:hypothetical protein
MNSQRQGYEGWWQGGHRGWPGGHGGWPGGHGYKKCYKIIFLRRVCTFVSLYIFSKYIVKIKKNTVK